MAFPYIFHSNFAAGTNGEWDSESDTGSRLDFPFYATMAQIPGMPAPFRGAYCMRIELGDTNDHTLIEGDIDIADTVTRYSSFMLYAGANVTATANDTFAIYEVQGTANAIENSVGLRITAASNLLEIGVGNVAPTAFAGLSRGVWHHVELVSVVQTGGTGTATLWLDGASVASVDTLTNTAVLRGVLGTQDTLSTTSGTLLFNEFIFDDTQVYAPVKRFPSTVRVLKSGQVFVGPGWIESATILSANGTMDLYDTDTGNTNQAQAKKVELNTGGNFVSNDAAVYFERGCYVALAGTNPYGEVQLMTTPRKPGMHGPVAHWGDGAIRNYGIKRVARPQNV